MLKVLVVDDEPLARQRVCQFVVSFSGFTVIGEAQNGLEALRKCEALQPDIIIVDIRMPGLDGIELAQKIQALNNPPAIIFSTAYDEYAMKAFAAHAIDYVLKPVARERLEEALLNAVRPNKALLVALASAHNESTPSLTIKKGRNVELIPLSDISYLLADQKYTRIHYSHGDCLTEQSLKAIEELYPDFFIRIHRNALVARKKIKGLKQQAGQFLVILFDGAALEVSRRHLSQVRTFLKHPE